MKKKEQEEAVFSEFLTRTTKQLYDRYTAEMEDYHKANTFKDFFKKKSSKKTFKDSKKSDKALIKAKQRR